MPLTPNDSPPSAAVNGLDTALPIPEHEDWDWEIAMDPYPSGKMKRTHAQQRRYSKLREGIIMPITRRNVSQIVYFLRIVSLSLSRPPEEWISTSLANPTRRNATG
uniref:Uncharacterized protein n=1 Tax=Magallana gigas TaxID=29159 RepID=K1PKI2_MAGGI